MGDPLPILALAYGLDLLAGDPAWWPHPVRAMGAAIGWGERLLRRVVPWERVAGGVLVAAVVGTTYAATAWLLLSAHALSPWLGGAAAVALLWNCLSTKDLAVESRHVLRALEANDLPLARQRVARIVGRDTHDLSSAEVVRATVETIAESIVDGILSPLFYFLLGSVSAAGGVPLAMAYKAVNTLDSMIGHRSPRYIRFGWAAARLDTLANWIPARCSAIVIAAGAWLLQSVQAFSPRLGGAAHPASPRLVGGAHPDFSRPAAAAMAASWRCAWRDGARSLAPNAGIPEAAMAGALGVQLGGVNRYHGEPRPGPLLGDPQRPLEPARIREAIRLLYAASFAGWLMAAVICYVL